MVSRLDYAHRAVGQGKREIAHPRSLRPGTLLRLSVLGTAGLVNVKTH
jgi:hypothetical protein